MADCAGMGGGESAAVALAAGANAGAVDLVHAFTAHAVCCSDSAARGQCTRA